jgi:uncharacterized membrane protein
LAKSAKGAAVKQIIAQQFREVSTFSGPLPPPEIVEYYNKIIPDGADRLLKMVEVQSEHRRNCETAGLNASISITKRGQNFAFILSVLGFTSAILCAYLGQPVPSSIIGGGTLIGLASLFIKGYWHKKLEKKNEASNN